MGIHLSFRLLGDIYITIIHIVKDLKPAVCSWALGVQGIRLGLVSGQNRWVTGFFSPL